MNVTGTLKMCRICCLWHLYGMYWMVYVCGVWGISMLYGSVNKLDFYVCSLYGVCEVNMWCGGIGMVWVM